MGKKRRTQTVSGTLKQKKKPKVKKREHFSTIEFNVNSFYVLSINRFLIGGVIKLIYKFPRKQKISKTNRKDKMCYSILLFGCFQCLLIYSYQYVFFGRQPNGFLVQNVYAQRKVSERTRQSQAVISIHKEENNNDTEWDEGEVPWDFVEEKNKTSVIPSRIIPVLKGIKFSKNELDKIIFLII
jgi:hypothetical protein